MPCGGKLAFLLELRLTNQCWIATGGNEILGVVRDTDRVARTNGDFRPHVFEKYGDFVAIHTNIDSVRSPFDHHEWPSPPSF